MFIINGRLVIKLQLFLQDSYLNYIGWTLNDRETNVRKASLKSVLSLYQEADANNIAKLELFTTRFLKRFSEMVLDSDASVSCIAIELMTCLLKCGLLSEKDGEVIPSL